MKRFIIIIGGLVGIAVGFGFILPAWSIMSRHGMLPHLGLLSLGLLLATGGGGAAFLGLKRFKS